MNKQDNKADGRGMRMAVACAAAILLAACASIGRPNGGEYDYVPPKFVKANPAIGARNVNTTRLVYEFDENIKLEDVMNKVVVSPAQKSIPSVTANGRKLTVDIRDTLIDNATYTIDFSDAIRDLNESNILDGFAVDFSTGDSIDTLRISGMVFEARTLEPAQGMLVGVYSNLSDTAITTLPFERIAKTNQLGQFSIRGLKPGRYRIYAVNDVNRDLHWDRSEDLAYYDMLLEPTAEQITVTDTLLSITGEDSLANRPGVQYLPNDVLLTWFNGGNPAQYMDNYGRPERNKITIQMAAKADSLPQITLADGQMAGRDASLWSILQSSPTYDTLTYFITDTMVSRIDSLRLAVRYMQTDTLQRLVWKTDTLRFTYKEPRKSKDEEKKERRRIEKLERARQEAIERGDSVIPEITGKEIKYLAFSVKSGSTQDLNKPMIFATEQPIAQFDSSAVTFEVMRDTVWDTIAAPSIIQPDMLNPLSFIAEYEWAPGTKYRLTIDSAAIIGAFGEWNKAIVHEFTTKNPEDYATFYVSLTGVSDSAVVELLDRSDKVVRQQNVKDAMAEFTYVTPGEYYMRLFIDANGNGLWDNGVFSDTLKQQPEEVYYFPKKLTLKKNWDVEQAWNIYETAIDKQKPEDIKKNKPKETKKRRRRADGTYIDGDDDRRRPYDEEEDEFYNDEMNGNFFGPGNRNGSSNIGNMHNFNSGQGSYRR